MTRGDRIIIGLSLVMGMACMATQRAAEVVPAEDRVALGLVALRAACTELKPGVSLDATIVCERFLKTFEIKESDAGE